MMCPFCKAENKGSTLIPDSFGTSTLMAYSPGHYEEDGTWIRGRDPNWHTQGYSVLPEIPALFPSWALGTHRGGIGFGASVIIAAAVLLFSAWRYEDGRDAERDIERQDQDKKHNIAITKAEANHITAMIQTEANHLSALANAQAKHDAQMAALHDTHRLVLEWTQQQAEAKAAQAPAIKVAAFDAAVSVVEAALAEEASK